MAPATLARSTSRDSRSASLRDLVGGEGLAVEHTTLDHQERVRLAKSRRPFATTTGSPSMKAIAVGPTEVLLDAVDPGLPGGDRGQRVLRHGVGGVVTERAAQLLQRLHGESAVLGQHSALRAGEPAPPSSATAATLSGLAIRVLHNVPTSRATGVALPRRAGSGDKRAPVRRHTGRHRHIRIGLSRGVASRHRGRSCSTCAGHPVRESSDRADSINQRSSASTMVRDPGEPPKSASRHPYRGYFVPTQRKGPRAGYDDKSFS